MCIGASSSISNNSRKNCNGKSSSSSNNNNNIKGEEAQGVVVAIASKLAIAAKVCLPIAEVAEVERNDVK